MKDKPRKRKSPILNQEMKVLIFIIGILTDLGLFGLFLYFWKTTGDIDYTRTIVFAALGIDSLFYVFSVRSLRKSIFRMNPFSNKYLILAVGAGLGLQILALYHPFLQKALHLQSIGWFEWLIVIIVGIVNVILIEIVKEIYNLRKRRKLEKIT